MGPMVEQDIRGEIAKVLDRLAELDDGALDERLRLGARLTELRSQLRSIEIEGAAAIEAGWSERAGLKPDENPDRSVIASPSAGGACAC